MTTGSPLDVSGDDVDLVLLGTLCNGDVQLIAVNGRAVTTGNLLGSDEDITANLLR